MKKEGGQNRQDKEKKVNRAGSSVSQACRGMCMPLLFGLLCVAGGVSVVAQADEANNPLLRFLLQEDDETSDSDQPTKEVKWYRAAAEQGDAEAQSNLGVCYKNGWGVNEDMAEAVKWFRAGAEQGYVQAQYSLGVCYENGWGVSKDIAEAVKWYRAAAEQGNEAAKKALQNLRF